MALASRPLSPALRLVSPAFFVALAAFLGLGLGGWAEPVVAQSRNIATVSGPGSGEQTTLSQIPQRVTDRVSLRAIGVRAPDSTRWALSVIGGDDIDSFAFRAAGSTFEPVRIERPDGAGPTTLHLEQRDFLTLARTSGAVIVLDGERAPIPASLRRDMKAVFEKVV